MTPQESESAITELQQRLIDRTKAYEEMDVKRVRRIRQLEDTIRRARTAFMEGGSYATVAFKMIKILDEEEML